MAVSASRLAAYEILLRVQREQAYAADLLHSSRLGKLSLQDRALCTELVMGVLRWQSLLDAQFADLLPRPLDKLDLEVLVALRMGTYQVVMLERIPAHAAVHDSVELVKRARKTSAAGMVNSILRKMSGLRTRGSPAVFRQPILEALEREPQQASRALEMATAHPRWLVERWVGAFGLTPAIDLCLYDQQAPATALRLGPGSAQAELAEAGIVLAPGALLARARRVVLGDVTKTKAFAAGRVAIQDEASQLVAALVGTGVRILDCCAAPGGKTAALAERNPQSLIVAAELHPHRARTLRRRAQQANIHVIAADALALPLDLNFDRVLADVPCSGTGTLARNPEIKWRLAPANLADLHRKQVAILRAALDRMAPGGRLVYSTCSLEAEENADVVEEALAARKDCHLLDCSGELRKLQEAGELVWSEPESLTREGFLQTLPGIHPCDGFFAAVIERRA